jgi:hypothetical protein
VGAGEHVGLPYRAWRFRGPSMSRKMFGSFAIVAPVPSPVSVAIYPLDGDRIDRPLFSAPLTMKG